MKISRSEGFSREISASDRTERRRQYFPPTDALHDQTRAHDAARDRKLARMGYRVLRIPASVVTGDLTRAVEMVQEALGG